VLSILETPAETPVGRSTEGDWKRRVSAPAEGDAQSEVTECELREREHREEAEEVGTGRRG